MLSMDIVQQKALERVGRMQKQSIHWIAIYLLDSVIQHLKNWGLHSFENEFQNTSVWIS